MHNIDLEFAGKLDSSVEISYLLCLGMEDPCDA